MALLELIKHPNKLLREKSLPVTNFDSELKEFMNSLCETMYYEKGIGIAAIQVGKPIRALIVDVPKDDNSDSEIKSREKREPIYIINPEIIEISEEKIILPEGCLSVKEEDVVVLGLPGNVERPKSLTVKYVDLNGKSQELKINGDESNHSLWVARCLQHEIDHLNGILFIDKLVQPIQGNNVTEINGGIENYFSNNKLEL